MKKFLALLTGFALAGGAALAQEQEDTVQDPLQDTTSEYGEDVGEIQESSTYGHESGMEHGLSALSAEELQGMTVVSSSGEEIGEIDRIGQSEQHQERVATVDVGGFLGVAEKTIAIPLSDLEMSPDGNVQTTMTKDELETAEEFDEQGFTEEGSSTEDTGY